MKMTNLWRRSSTSLHHKLALIAAALGVSALSVMGAEVVLIKQQNNVEQTQTTSAFFTNSPDNVITLGPQVGFSGTIGAGDGPTTVSSATIVFEGNSTSAGGWTDGNGIPAGITLSFKVQFTVSTPTPDSFLTTQNNSGAQLGNGIGITQTAGTIGTTGVDEILEVSAITISDVTFSGSVAEPGFMFTPGTVRNPRWNRLRSNNFAESSAGLTVTVGDDTWGYGLSTGNQGSNLFIENNYTTDNGLLTAGPMTFTTQVGTWNLKGLGFRYEIAYEIEGQAVVPTWTGAGPDSFWSTGANWDGGLAPADGQAIRFGAANRQANTNDIPNLNLSILTFTAGGFNLYGNSITNDIGLTNLTGINHINLGVNYSGANARAWHIAAGSQLSIGGAVHSYGNGNFEISGGGAINVGNGGSISLDVNTANGNVRLGTIAGDTVTLNVNSGGTVSIGNAATGNNANRLRIGAVAGATGILNINEGGTVISPDDAGNQTRSLVELGQAAGAVAVLNLNAGGLLHAQRIESNNPDVDSTFNFNGGLLLARKISASTTYFNNVDRVQVQAGGAFIEVTNSVTSVMPLAEDPASPGGGLTKFGEGLMVLPAGNTYTGPTLLDAGTLSLALPANSTAVTLNTATELILNVNDSSWNANSATFESGTSTLTLHFGANGPVSTPLMVNNLAANGTVIVNVTGAFTSVGSFPLIDYTIRTGAGNFVLGAAPPGTVAALVTNAVNSSIDLQISAVVSDLYWTGNVNGDWDIGVTANWDFLSGGAGATTYNENAISGDYVTFFNGAANSAITLKADVRPGRMLFFNSSTEYSIDGSGVGIYGGGQMIVAGGGVVRLMNSNSFSGGISNALGFVEAGHDNALGAGRVTLWPTTTGLKNVGLRSDGAGARTIENEIQFRSFGEDELNFQLGDESKNGRLLFSGPVDWSARRNEISVDSEVEFSGVLTNGCFSKTGPGRLVMSGNAAMTIRDQIVAEGEVVVNGGTWSNNPFGLRLVARDGVVSRLVLTNNGRMTFAGGSNLRVAGATSGGFAQGTGINEFIMYSGELNLIGTAGEASIGNPASLSSLGRITLNGGTTTLRGLRGLANGGPTELVLNDATLIASMTGAANLANFISGFTNATILAGGVVIDIPEGRIAFASQSLEGVGGIAKNGAGTLFLDGANSYGGTTFVNAGILGGGGIISGPVVVGAAGTLSPGQSIGTLTVNNTLNLAGTTLMEVDKAEMTSDLVTGLTAVQYGGALVVANLSAAPLEGGEVFQLFNAAGSSGNFSSVTILPDTGLTGTFDPATGQLTIGSSVVQPVIHPPLISDGNFILTGTGSPNGTYSILASTNVAAPLLEWTSIFTGAFGGSGEFSNAIPVTAGPRQFFLIQTH